MNNERVIETSYPLTFRKQDSEQLGRHIKLRDSVELVGMKRVGISNFLRFFLYHEKIVPTYINGGEKHLFIPVDLNDLIECELQPFWILAFKRILDAVEHSEETKTIQQKISSLFLMAIQAQDLFLTLENIRQALSLIIAEGIDPTIFLIRFDRLEPAISREFFNNLQGLIESSNHKLSFVFTSFSPLNTIKPDVFHRRELASFSHVLYVKTATHDDILTIYNTLQAKFNFNFTKQMIENLLTISGGHVQYLHLMLVILHEKLGETMNDLNQKEILEKVSHDERTRLQSEEIWESLASDEKEALYKIASHKKVSTIPEYLLHTGLVTAGNTIFSPLFEQFLHHATKPTDDVVEFSKKEHKLYNLLLENHNEICEREKIIEEVWPEYEEIGVSDWTIDRLVARVRAKLSQQQSQYSIVTVKTRGYKLV